MEEEIFVYDQNFKNMMSFPTFKNKGVLCLSPEYNNLVLSYPSSSKIGLVKTYSFTSKNSGYIQAHDSMIGMIASSRDGSRIATCSEKGTVLRIFDTEKSEKIKEVRRGSTPATITSISFSSDCNYLCTASEKGTVHLFSIEKDINRKSSLSYFNYVPLVNVQYIDSEWSMAEFQIQNEGKLFCFFGDNSNIINVITEKGNFFTMTYNPLKKEFIKEVNLFL